MLKSKQILIAVILLVPAIFLAAGEPLTGRLLTALFFALIDVSYVVACIMSNDRNTPAT